MTLPWIAGLDISIRSTGYAAPNGTMHTVASKKPAGERTAVAAARRYNDIAERLWRTMVVNPPMPRLVVIEAPLIVREGNAGALHQVHGVIRDRLLRADAREVITFVDVNSTTLKSFATGNGHADKELMKHTCWSRIRAVGGAVEPRNSDEADAWHLRRFGRVACGEEEALAQFETDAVERSKIVWPIGELL